MKIKEIIAHLEKIAPPSLQEDYDNAGLLTGQAAWDCTGVLVALDATEPVVDDAIRQNCNLVVAHHPIIFRGLKKITGKNYVEQTLIKAIKNDIAIYAIHTNLDNVIHGVNGKIADMLGLVNRRILAPKNASLQKLVVFVPRENKAEVMDAMFAAGAGEIGKYSECSFSSDGTGSFKAGEETNPHVGEKGKRHLEPEARVEVILPRWRKQSIVAAMKAAHPYEEVAFDLFDLANESSLAGSGLLGELPEPCDEGDLLDRLSRLFHIPAIKHTALTGKPAKRIAICGGAGSFLTQAAKAAGADVFITGDVKYHEFFDAEGKLLLADIGHYESEQFTITLLHDILREKFPNFAVLKTGVNTNPVHYFTRIAETGNASTSE